MADFSRLLLINAAEGLLQLLFASTPATPPPAAWTIDAFEEVPAASQGAEILAPRIRAGLDRLGLRPLALTHIAAVRGPGGFTGLRLALATAAGLARATGALRAGLDYMPLPAASALTRLKQAEPPERAEPLAEPRTRPEGLPVFWTITHARRNLVHAQGFSVVAGDTGPVLGPALSPLLALPPEEALGLVAALGAGRKAYLLGSGLGRNREAFERGAVLAGAAAPVLLGPEFDHPAPEALLAAASTAVFADKDPEPLYLRPPDAEENLEAIAASLNLDPAAARRRLRELTGRLS